MISNERFLDELNDELLSGTGVYCAYNKYCGQLKLEQLFTTDSVYMAACHCASGFRSRNDTSAFMQSAWRNSMLLAEKVVSEKFRPEYYRTREITERGKKRIIRPPKFESKIVQKVVCDYLLRTLLEPKMVSTNYASIRGRGTEKAYQDVLCALNKRGHVGSVIVMTDFSDYFASINLKLLRGIFERYISDIRVVNLIMMFADEGKGLSLGNETSQIPASYFPSVIDHYIKDRLGNSDYFRFMDDILILAGSEAEADMFLETVKDLSEKQCLTIKDEKIHMVHYGKDFEYCKERFLFNQENGYYYRHMNPQILRNERRKLRRFAVKVQSGEMEIDAVRSQARGVFGSINSRPNTYHDLTSLQDLYQELFNEAAPK